MLPSHKITNLPIKIKSHLTLILIIFLMAISYYYNLHHIRKYQSKVFYLPIYRFWELLSGALLAHLTISSQNISIKRFLTEKNYNLIFKNLISIIAIILAIIILFKMNKSFFPGKKAIIPILIAILLISARENSVINKYILCNRGLVFVGLISYPLYLWHWPILSFVHILGGQGRIELLPIILLLTFALSFLTYKFIENPLRYSKLRTVPIILLIILTIIGFAGYIIFKHNGYPKRLANSYSIALDNPCQKKDYLEWRNKIALSLDNQDKSSDLNYHLNF